MSPREPVGPLAQLREELMRGAAQHPRMARTWAASATAQPRRRHGSGLRWLGFALPSALAIVVAVGTLTLIGHGHATRRHAAGLTCTSRLLAELGVLRRPQTAADLAFHPPEDPYPGAGQDGFSTSPYTLRPGLTRLARTLPGGSQVFLAVYTPTPGAPAAAIGDLVLIYALARPGHPAALAGEVSGLTLASAYRLPPERSGDSLFTVVPDQVASVEWTFPRQQLRLGHGRVGRILRGGTVTADVTGNIAAAAALPDSTLFPTVTRWLNAGGTVIKSFRQPAARVINTSAGPTTITSQGVVVGTVSPATGACQPR